MNKGTFIVDVWTGWKICDVEINIVNLSISNYLILLPDSTAVLLQCINDSPFPVAYAIRKL